MFKFKNILGASAAALMCLAMAACTDVKYEEAPSVPGASNVSASVEGRKVTLKWALPGGDIQNVVLLVNGDNNTAITLPKDATSYTFKTQPMAQELVYTVKVRYTNGLLSEGVSTITTVPYIEPTFVYVLTADSPSGLADDDEIAAATWFKTEYVDKGRGKFLKPTELGGLDPDRYPVIWVEIDRVGMPLGWENLPSAYTDAKFISDLKKFSEEGGSLYLANFATELTVPMGFVSEDMRPSLYGNGTGGTGNDTWVINPQLGWDFREGGEQGFYDHSGHQIFAGITLEDPNGYGYPTIPLIGPGMREDHNCGWDCNIYGKGTERDVIANFEKLTDSTVLATWGHVRDHCVAVLVAFNATSAHGRCVAMGAAAYEWNQNSGVNPYQGNVEKITSNILNFLN